ncbi:MAG: RIP metalloprotease RseP [Dysgonamonadaceae bacterium]|nr:RIP metalloprotease RseP [Dysgonamonadaceae bacterium]
METIFVKALQLVLSLSILVIIHEFGHFLFAKIFKVRVEKFYLFFNPWFSLIKYKPRNSDTEYGIGWLPVGGYVKISGMIDESLDKEALSRPPQPWEFRTKSSWQRLLIMVGGVLMNFILAFFIYSIIVLHWGDNYTPMDKIPLYFGEVAHEAGFRDGDILLSADGEKLTRYDELDIFRVIKAEEITLLRDGQEQTVSLPEDFKLKVIASKMPFVDFRQSIVDSIIPGGIAQRAGLLRGDRIISLNGHNTNSFSTLTALLSKSADTDVALKILRNGEEIELTSHVSSEGKIDFAILYHDARICDHYNIITAFPAGIKLGFRKLSFYVLQLRLVFTKEGVQNIGGFGAIGNLFPPQWNWLDFWNMTALLSIMLGVMNLLPIPALDGGHVLFLLYEVITRRKPSDKFLEKAQYIGMVLLILLMVYANGNDILRVFQK